MKFINHIKFITFLMTIILILIVFNISIGEMNRFHAEQAYQSIIDQKKIYIKENVNNQIIRIEDYQMMFTKNLIDLAESNITNNLDETSTDQMYIDRFDQMNDIQQGAFTTIVLKDDVVIYNPSNYSYPSDETNYAIDFYDYDRYTIGNYEMFIGYNKTFVDSKVFDRIKEDIMNQEYELHTYMWINQILNYDGGDDYAVRFIHPNSNPASGVMLSTNTEVYGKYPYLIELEGIKANQEIYFTYHFKLPNSDLLAEKITYAKLYEPYDWVISMGIYFEDIDYYLDIYEAETSQFTIQIQVIFVGIFMLANAVNYIVTNVIRKKEMKNLTINTYEEANRDELTTAYLRRVAIKHYDDYLAIKMKDHNRLIGFVLFDIDDFKMINDTYGHKMGDFILKGIVDYIKSQGFDQNDIYRWGGDEFVLMLEYDNLELLIEKITHLKDAISNQKFHLVGQEFSQITISAGITDIRSTDQGIDDSVFRADQAMYESKKMGGNCVTIAS